MGNGVSKTHYIAISRVIGCKDIDKVKCSLCRGILWKPMKCSPCETLFCSACIQKTFAKQQKCPNGCSTLVLQNCPSTVTDLLSQLKITCRNKSYGCPTILPYDLFDSFLEHQRDCEFRPCQCEGCKKYVAKKYFERHNRECALVTLVCDKCGASFKRQDRAVHTSVVCLQTKNDKELAKWNTQPSKAEQPSSHFTADGQIQRVFDIQKEPTIMLLPIEGYQDVPLLTLENAVKNLEAYVPNVTRNAWIATERTAVLVEKLSQNESAAIHLYSMEWTSSRESLYLQLNAALRAESRRLLVPYFPYLKLILTALFKLPAVKKTVWRGVKMDLSDQYTKGSTFVWWGFSSCTDSLELLETENFLGKKGVRTLFNIESDSGRAIQNHSYYKEESEIILLPATSFQVLGKINPSPGLHIIHLREVKPRFPLLQLPFPS